MTFQDQVVSTAVFPTAVASFTFLHGLYPFGRALGPGEKLSVSRFLTTISKVRIDSGAFGRTISGPKPCVNLTTNPSCPICACTFFMKTGLWHSLPLKTQEAYGKPPAGRQRKVRSVLKQTTHTTKVQICSLRQPYRSMCALPSPQD